MIIQNTCKGKQGHTTLTVWSDVDLEVFVHFLPKQQEKGHTFVCYCWEWRLDENKLPLACNEDTFEQYLFCGMGEKSLKFLKVHWKLEWLQKPTLWTSLDLHCHCKTRKMAMCWSIENGMVEKVEKLCQKYLTTKSRWYVRNGSKVAVGATINQTFFLNVIND